MKYFMAKLLPPRPTFAQDMSPDEAALMRQHAAYWRGLLEQGQVPAFGPVADPGGAFGLGLLELADDVDPRSLVDQDPVVLAGIGFRCELTPMPMLVSRRMS